MFLQRILNSRNPNKIRRMNMKALTMMKNFIKRDEGQTLSEYALILILIAVVAIVAVTFLGGQITAVLNQIGNAL